MQRLFHVLHCHVILETTPSGSNLLCLTPPLDPDRSSTSTQSPRSIALSLPVVTANRAHSYSQYGRLSSTYTENISVVSPAFDLAVAAGVAPFDAVLQLARHQDYGCVSVQALSVSVIYTGAVRRIHRTIHQEQCFVMDLSPFNRRGRAIHATVAERPYGFGSPRFVRVLHGGISSSSPSGWRTSTDIILSSALCRS